MHRFYDKPKRKQLETQWWVALGALTTVLAAAFIAWKTGAYWTALLITPVVISIVAPFFDVPALIKSGKLSYHSALFLAEKPKNGVINVHGGTLFDYVFVLDWDLSGAQRTNFIIQQYLQGLLDLIAQHRGENADGLTIRATSYILNERTAAKMGFQKSPTSAVQTVLLFFNYFPILLTYSLAKKRLAFPRLDQTHTFEAEMADLLKRKDFISDWNNRLKARA